MSTHARLSPSSSDRWINCPASPAVAAQYPADSSVYADEGTAAHTLAAWCLEGEKDAVAFLGRLIEVPARDGGQARSFEVDLEMAGYVQEYLDRTRQWAGFDGANLFVENRLPIDSITGEEDASGTADAVLVVPRGGSNDIVIRDLKYGRGVPVAARENTQLLIYAAAALEAMQVAFDFDDGTVVRMEIDQPRRGHFDSWSIMAADLRERIARISKAAAVARKTPADGKRVAGDWCKFCPAKADCPTRAAYVAETVTGSAGFEAITAGPLPAPDHSKLGWYLSRVQAIRDWCSAVEEAAHSTLLSGGTVPGYKLVLGRQGDRKWADEKAAETTLISHGASRSAIFTAPKLRSPAQVEKLIPKEARPLLAPLITRSEAQPQVAPESDSRPAYSATDATGFTAADDAA